MNYGSRTLTIESAKCTGCRMCTEVCPHAVLAVENRQAVVRHAERCMECGACQRNCPAGAIRVDTGVGCAAALIRGAITGGPAECGCSQGKKNGGGCCG